MTFIVLLSPLAATARLNSFFRLLLRRSTKAEYRTFVHAILDQHVSLAGLAFDFDDAIGGPPAMDARQGDEGRTFRRNVRLLSLERPLLVTLIGI
jgi:hypothetical protein